VALNWILIMIIRQKISANFHSFLVWLKSGCYVMASVEIKKICGSEDISCLVFAGKCAICRSTFARKHVAGCLICMNFDIQSDVTDSDSRAKFHANQFGGYLQCTICHSQLT